MSRLEICCHTWVKWWLKFIHFHSRKCIQECLLENGGHFISASMCQHSVATLQWNGNWNSYIFIQENVFKNVVRKMATILSRLQCVSILLFRWGDPNIALFCSATQSSTYVQWEAGKAVDGKLVGDQFVSSTDDGDLQPWWKVQLPCLFWVTQVEIIAWGGE